MKLITWNVNGARPRLARIKALLQRHEPDVLCLQEVKMEEAQFPADELADLGYSSAVFGQKTYNGVATVTRRALENIRRGFPHDPVPEQARVLAGDIDGLTVINVYVVNGEALDSPKYAIKLEWLDALAAWLAEEFDPARPVVVLGDFNIAPEDRDVHDPEALRGSVHCSEPERERLGALYRWGLRDLLREQTPEAGLHTWWDYRAGAFHRGWGLRIDLILGTGSVAERVESFQIDRDERKPTFGEGKPSDHAPFVVEVTPALPPGSWCLGVLGLPHPPRSRGREVLRSD